MSTTTVNTFPPLHALDSPKGWFIASIVLLHAGFFWALNNGFTLSVLRLPPPQTTVVEVPDKPTPPPEEIRPPIDTSRWSWSVPVPTPTAPRPVIDTFENTSNYVVPSATTESTRSVAPPAPVIVEPAIPRSGLSTPAYPPRAIRENLTGTVVLSVYVLANGRVGDVELISSSGHASLDESALREARRWRLVPGTKDGAPAPMWRKVPVKFELTTRM
jgi:protein TonB